MDHRQIAEDFAFLREDDRVLAVLIFGSQVTGNTHSRSDIDICIIAPDADTIDIMGDIWTNINTESKNYDIHTFKELSLNMKHQVMEHHETVWCQDRQQLEEHFYTFRKLWKDQAKARGVA